MTAIITIKTNKNIIITFVDSSFSVFSKSILSYPQEMRVVYNNPNIQYYNAANMNVPNVSNNNNPAPAPTVVNNLVTSSNMSSQSYNMIPQSST